MTRTLALILACGALAAACDRGAGDDTYNTELPLKELMAHVIDPGAWDYWDRSGEYMAPDGSWVSRLPPTPDSIPENPNTLEDDVLRIEAEREWHRAISGAAQVAEAGNLLLLPNRVRRAENDRGEWSQYASQLTEVALRAMEAAEAYDGQDMFDLGGEMYEVCTACHAKYLIPAVEAGKAELPAGVDAEGKPQPK